MHIDPRALETVEREALARVRALRERITAQLSALEESVTTAAKCARAGDIRGAKRALEAAREWSRAVCQSTAPVDALAAVIEGGAR